MTMISNINSILEGLNEFRVGVKGFFGGKIERVINWSNLYVIYEVDTRKKDNKLYLCRSGGADPDSVIDGVDEVVNTEGLNTFWDECREVISKFDSRKDYGKSGEGGYWYYTNYYDDVVKSVRSLFNKYRNILKVGNILKNKAIFRKGDKNSKGGSIRDVLSWNNIVYVVVETYVDIVDGKTKRRIFISNLDEEISFLDSVGQTNKFVSFWKSCENYINTCKSNDENTVISDLTKFLNRCSGDLVKKY